MKNPDGTTHPATFQPDICAELTPATVTVWLRKHAADAYAKDAAKCSDLVIAAKMVEKHLL
jgi:hypothetical protein